MSYITPQIPIIVRHVWRMKNYKVRVGSFFCDQSFTTSESFNTDELPGVTFNIFSGLVADGKVNVIVSKTPHYPAKVTIKISWAGVEKATVHIDTWINPYEFAEMSGGVFTDPFECEITWHGYVKNLPTYNLYHSVQHLLYQRELSDFTIIVGDERIAVHKVILASQSPYFFAMFTADMLESTSNQLIVEDIEIDIIKRVIGFLYTGKVDSQTDVDIIIAILSVADRYQIEKLKVYCAEVLAMNMAVINVLTIIENASLYRVHRLVEDAIYFMICNNHAIAQLDDFKDFGTKNPQLLTKYSIRLSETLQSLFREENQYLKLLVKPPDNRSA